MGRRDELIRILSAVDLGDGTEVNDSTPLFESGLLDSLALVRLADWVQTQIDEPIELANFNIQKQWATVGGVLSFIDNHRRQDKPSGA